MEAQTITRKSTRLTKKKSEVTGEKKDKSCEVPPPEESKCFSTSEVQCFCNDNKRGRGDCAMRDVCRTVPFEMLRMKEGLGVMDGRSFICCFCLSVKVLESTKLVGELRGEMIELRVSVEVLSKENDDLVERVMVAEGEWMRIECRGRVVETRKKPVSAISVVHPGGRKSEHGERADRERLRGGESRSGESPSLQ